MATGIITPIDEQRTFEFSELFFSTTDKKGVIRYGNSVFCRIADYTLSQMKGKPHNIIRHPDIPRSAFGLVWDYLERGRTVAAYVKNMARDGRYYWVMALIMPYDDGYLSIRLKPSSEIFKIVQGAYADILAVEKRAESQGASRKDAMKTGGERLFELLAGLGFGSYDEFMWAALGAEMTSRSALMVQNGRGVTDTLMLHTATDGNSHHAPRNTLVELLEKCKSLDHQLGDVFAKPGSFSQLRDEIIPKANFIFQLGNAIRLLSINAEIEAARLGKSAAALSMVAERLGYHAGEGISIIRSLNENLRQLTAPIAQLIFNSLVSKIQIEMTASFVEEILHNSNKAQNPTDCDTHNADLQSSVRLLTQTFLATTRQQILPELSRLQGCLATVNKQVHELQKFIRTLGFIYFTGKVETARYHNTQSFSVIFDQIKAKIGQSQSVLSQFLENIDANTTQLASIGCLDHRVFAELDALVQD